MQQWHQWYRCPRCGAQVAFGMRFCGSCGIQLFWPTQPTQQPPPIYHQQQQFGSRLQVIPTGDVEAIRPYCAGFWRRFAAYIIDSIILVIGELIFIAVFFIAVFSATGGLSTEIPDDYVIAFWFAYNILTFVLPWLYFTAFEASSKQATPGKMAMGIIVTDLKGNRISFGRANGRYWSKIISTAILLIGYIMIGFTEKKQGLHDIIADTLVLKKS